MTELVTTDWRGGDAAPPLGPLQQIDARVRVATAGAFALTAVALHSAVILGLAFALAVALAALARLPLELTLRRMLGMDAFMLPILLLLPFTVPGDAIGSIGYWPVSAEGVQQAARIVLTANTVVLALLALVGTIEPVLLGQAFLGLGMPEKLAQMLLLTARYVVVLQVEYARLRQAMRARAFRAAGSMHTWRSIGYLFGMLLVRGCERSERILEAMKCRGFTGRFHAVEAAPLRPSDRLFAATTVAALLLLIALECTR